MKHKDIGKLKEELKKILENEEEKSGFLNVILKHASEFAKEETLSSLELTIISHPYFLEIYNLIKDILLGEEQSKSFETIPNRHLYFGVIKYLASFVFISKK